MGTGTQSSGQVEIGGERYSWSLDNGMIHVLLPFRVDLERLARSLKEAGYFTSEGAEETGAQGWGSEFDAEGYYPYWVLPDDDEPEWTVFTYPPEDYDQFEAVATGGGEEAGAFRPFLGDLARQELARWLAFLKAAGKGGQAS